MELDDTVRLQIKDALARGADADEVARCLIEWLPRLCDRRSAHAHIEAIYDQANSDLDRLASTVGHGG
jgi:hypothetical protein